MGGSPGLKDIALDAFNSSGLKEDLVNVVNKGFRSAEDILDQSPAGKFIKDLHKNVYEPTFKEAQAKMSQQNMAAAKSAPINYNLEQQGPKPLSPGMITNKAHNIAKQVAYGPNHALLAHAYQWAAHTNGDTYAQLLLDTMHVQFQDTIQSAHDVKWSTKLKRQITAGEADVSAMKQDVIRNKKLNSELREKLNVSAKYVPRTPTEKFLTGFAATMQTPLIAINHLSTIGNTILTEPIASLNQGLASLLSKGGYAANRQLLIDSGVFNDEISSGYRDLYKYRQGLLGAAGQGKLGYMIGKAIHQPGFNVVRDLSLTFAGAVGKLSSERYARMYAANPRNGLAKLRLQEIGLDPGQILAQKGKLTQDQLQKAIYHAVDNKIFLNTKLNRSYYSQVNPVFRMAAMYHNYVKRQAAFLMNEAKLAYKVRGTDPLHTVKIAAALAVGFPALGTFTEMLEDYGHGKNGYKDTKERLKLLTGKSETEFDDSNLQKAEISLEQYLNFYSHVGGLGVLVSYTQGAIRSHLAQTILGPVLGQHVENIEDVIQSMRAGKLTKQAKKDIIRQTIPVAGSGIANAMYPPKKKKSSLKLGGMKGLSGNLSSLNN